MEFGVTTDSSSNCLLGETFRLMHLGETFHHFLADNYGDGVRKIFVVLNCHEPEFDYRKRVRFDSFTRTLYLDIMIDFDIMTSGGFSERRMHVIEKLAEDVTCVVSRHAAGDFDAVRFSADFREWISHYPDYPVSPASPESSERDLFAETGGECVRMVLEHFGPIASYFRLRFETEIKGMDQHAVLFSGEGRRLGVFYKAEAGRISVQPENEGEGMAKGRALLFGYDQLGEDGSAPLVLFKMDSTRTEVGRVPLLRAGDFRVAMKAVGAYLTDHPNVIFPEKRAKPVRKG